MWGERCLLVIFFPTALAQGFIESTFMPCTYSCTKLSCKSDVFYLVLLPTLEYNLIYKWSFHSLVWSPGSQRGPFYSTPFAFPQIYWERVIGWFIVGQRTMIYVLQSVPVLQVTWDTLLLRDFLVKAPRLCLVCKCQEGPQVHRSMSVLHTR